MARAQQVGRTAETPRSARKNLQTVAVAAVRAPAQHALQAVSPGVGVVSSVFRRSFDVRLLDRLFYFTGDQDRMHPMSVLAPDVFLTSARLGMRMEIKFPTIRIGSLFCRIEQSLPEIPRSKPSASLAKNLDVLRRVLKRFGKSSAFWGEEPHLLADLRADLSVAGKTAAVKYLRWFGAGPGLTPAFDDCFSGLLFCDRFLGEKRVETGDAFFDAAKPRTPLQAYWQLRMADEGRLSFLFEAFLNRVLGEKLSAADVLKCLRVGHTSGTDLLMGLDIYLTAYAAGGIRGC